MKQVVTVRNLTIGEGMPKICVPIVASTEAEIIAKAEEIMQYPADLIEWRADYFEDAYNLSAVASVLSGLPGTPCCARWRHRSLRSVSVPVPPERPAAMQPFLFGFSFCTPEVPVFPCCFHPVVYFLFLYYNISLK